MKTSIPKIAECYPFLIYCLVTLGGKRYNGNTYEDIKCHILMKNRIVYHNEGKGQIFDWFYGNFV